MNSRTLVAVIFCGLVTGCVNVNQQIAALNAKDPCCGTYAQMKYTPLLPVESRDVELSESSPVFLFDGQKKYFAAFTLPKLNGPYELTIESPTQPYGVAARPRLIFLDEQFRQLKNEAGEIALRGQGIPPRIDYFFNESNSGARYIIVYCDGGDGGTNDLQITPTYMTIGYTTIPIGATEQRVKRLHSPMGRLRLNLKPYEPRRVDMPK